MRLANGDLRWKKEDYDALDGLKTLKPEMSCHHYYSGFLGEARRLNKIGRADLAFYAPRPGAIPKHYIVMKRMQGQELHFWQQLSPTLKPVQLAEVMKQLLQDLLLLHDNGIVHCDIKPSNCMVGLSRGRITANIIDLGLAKEGENGHPMVRSTNIGVLKYMDPDFISMVPKEGYVLLEKKIRGWAVYLNKAYVGESLPYDFITDCYALGKVFYDLIQAHQKAKPRQFATFQSLRGLAECMVRRVPGVSRMTPTRALAALAVLKDGLEARPATSRRRPAARRL